MAVVVRLIPFAAVHTTIHDLTAAILFLLLAVPLAVLLDRSGFFTVLASRIGGGRHLAAGCGRSLHLGLPTLAAVVVGGIAHFRVAPPRANVTVAAAVATGEPVAGASAEARGDAGDADTVGTVETLRDEDRAALRVGTIVVVWLLLGFVIGERLGVPAWIVAAIALVGLAIRQRTVPWRQIPVHAAVLASGLGVLATATAAHLPVEQLLSIGGVPGELATIGVVTVGANAINNLPAVLVTLHALDGHHDRVWAVLLGANIGSSLWITGSLSSLLWQATMRRLGHTITAVRFFHTAGRVGFAALTAATAARILVLLVARI